MNKNYFEIIRAGINTTFQDQGRKNLYHIGIPFSGAMDNRNYLLSNTLVGNKYELPVLEFAYQGPLLRYSGKKINIAVTGDVNFLIKKNDAIGKKIKIKIDIDIQIFCQAVNVNKYTTNTGKINSAVERPNHPILSAFPLDFVKYLLIVVVAV